MTEPRNHAGGAPASGPGHEKRDVDARKLTLLAVVLVAVVAVCLVLTLWMFDFFAGRADRAQPPTSPLAVRSTQQQPPEPRLQETPLKDIREMRAEEEVILETYGWVDREKGVVRIPIRRAMELVVEEGLPTRKMSGGRSVFL